VTIEKYPVFAEIAKRNLAQNGFFKWYNANSQKIMKNKVADIHKLENLPNKNT